MINIKKRFLNTKKFNFNLLINQFSSNNQNLLKIHFRYQMNKLKIRNKNFSKKIKNYNRILMIYNYKSKKKNNKISLNNNNMIKFILNSKNLNNIIKD